MTVKEFVKWMYPVAKMMDDINPIFRTAQAALESGWGKSKIGEYNLFGVTKGSWTGKTKLILTTEFFDTANKKFTSPEKVVKVIPVNGRFKYTVYREFRDYKSLTEALNDHQRILMKPGFSDAWPYRHSPIEFAKKLQDCVGCKYATDPNYVSTMTKLFAMVEKVVKQERI